MHEGILSPIHLLWGCPTIRVRYQQKVDKINEFSKYHTLWDYIRFISATYLPISLCGSFV